jgi:hypothetical protein
MPRTEENILILNICDQGMEYAGFSMNMKSEFEGR